MRLGKGDMDIAFDEVTSCFNLCWHFLFSQNQTYHTLVVAYNQQLNILNKNICYSNTFKDGSQQPP